VKKLLFTFILTALIISACSGKSAPAPTETQPSAAPIPSHPTPSAAELKFSDPAQTIKAAAGGEFTITVKTFLATGYHWELAEALDTKIVDYVWKDHVPDDPNNPNSSGRDIWRFKAIAPGTTTITLGYYQGMTTITSQTPVFTIVVK
jgi:predicted secreted protein